jgi:hypothetical protein
MLSRTVAMLLAVVVWSGLATPARAQDAEPVADAALSVSLGQSFDRPAGRGPGRQRPGDVIGQADYRLEIAVSAI